ncbi:MAG TPA: DUF6488 family protein [Allosphingosinicella sp.]|nr:DUF6488 family protein [Allosphingosinicella sp.]
MRLALVALAAVGGFTTPAVAHPGGHAEEYATQRRPISEIAQESVVKLVTQAKLPASWSKAKVVKSELRLRGGFQRWVVTFQNPAERNPAKRPLYVIMTMDGKFVSANHRLI